EVSTVAQQSHPDARTRLLDSYNREYACGTTNCGHGPFPPKASSPSRAGSGSGAEGERYAPDNYDGPSGSRNGLSSDLGHQDEARSMSTTKMLAKKHGVKNTRRM